MNQKAKIIIHHSIFYCSNVRRIMNKNITQLRRTAPK